MKTKIITLTVLIFIFSLGIINGQDTTAKLLVKYDKGFLEELKTTNPLEFDFLVYYANKACYPIDMPSKPIPYKELKRINPSTGELSKDQNILISHLENLNPLEYNIEYEVSAYTYYKVGETGKILVVPSRRDMENAVKNQRKIEQLNLKQ